MAAPGGIAFEVLYDTRETAETAAERIYGAPLRFPSGPGAYVAANFVTTIDGVVSLGLTDGTDASAISGHSTADRFVMAMLRAAADVVLIGSGTLRAAAGHQWVPERLATEHRDALAGYRASLGKPPRPAPLAVVSASGRLPSHVALTQPATDVLVVTGTRGAATVRETSPELEVVEAGEDVLIPGDRLVSALHRALGCRLILCEGGPTLLGSLMAAQCVDELFLTISPRVAGRDGAHDRLGLLRGYAAEPPELPTASLQSARRAEDHLLLRYRFER